MEPALRLPGRTGSCPVESIGRFARSAIVHGERRRQGFSRFTSTTARVDHGTMTRSTAVPPVTLAQARACGWDELDVVLITGDANVDHPSFPAALLVRWLIAHGFRAGCIARPDPADAEAVAQLGQPRLFFGVTAGALDSMVANYTASRRHRSDDPYAPEGQPHGRPDRAVTVYCNAVRRRYGKAVFIVAGGLEASLRAFAHYDYWSNSVRRPLLMDCGADLIVRGMGETPLLEIARGLDVLVRADPAVVAGARQRRNGVAELFAARVRTVAGVVFREPAARPVPDDVVQLPSFEAVSGSGELLARAFTLQENAGDRPLCQECAGMRVVAQPLPAPLNTAELDALYALPFTRAVHPSLHGAQVPALTQVRFSITAHRGCFGGCAFCALGMHQGKLVASRSEASILDEVDRITKLPGFRGTINDIGGPSANMYGSQCGRARPCDRPSCLWPTRCRDLVVDQQRYLRLLAQARAHPAVRHLFVTTGVRMDLALLCPPLIEALAFEHTSGHLKVAPEHVVPHVLELMRKPAACYFEEFLTLHRRLSVQAGRRQYVLPYLMAAHPGCTLEDMLELALFMRAHDLIAEQCQIFTPLPGTAAGVMYATGLEPATLRPVSVERDGHMKELHKALILAHLPEQAAQVRAALKKLGRTDLFRAVAGRRRA
jgi:uncharacterized radical SAM protein YgiQ